MGHRSDLAVSVVVAVRLPAPFLSAAIESLTAQTLVPDEIIVVAHGCGDELRGSLSPFGGLIRVVDADASLSLAEVRTFGLLEARCEFVAVLDSDDVALRDRIAMQLQALRASPKSVLCASEVELIDESGSCRGQAFLRPAPGDVRQSLILRNRIAHSSVMFRRQTAIDVGAYRDLPLAEDYDLWLRLAASGEFAYLDQALSQYRVHAAQLTSRRAVPRSAWRALRESRLALSRSLGRSEGRTLLEHYLWCASQMRRWNRAVR